MIRSQKNAGFTLLEVMIALVIVGLTLLAMAGKMGSMLNAANTMRDYTYASWIAHNKITEMRWPILFLMSVHPVVRSNTPASTGPGVQSFPKPGSKIFTVWMSPYRFRVRIRSCDPLQDLSANPCHPGKATVPGLAARRVPECANESPAPERFYVD